jgi:transglutaminase-like putative cysteine protease
MSSFALLVLASPLLLGGEPPPESARVERANSVERVVRFELRVANLADDPQDVEIRLPLPQANERQEIIFLFPEPGFEDILEDQHGNRVARYVEKAVEPGGCRGRGWIAAVRLHAAVYLPDASKRALSAEERALHTRDTPNYGIASAEVTAVRDSCVREGMQDEEKAEAFFRWLVHNVTYLRDNDWVPAPEVLRARKGSCSEYNYVLVALLRSAGIPCRSTGAVILTTDNEARYDAAVHEDRIFHRWTEIWLEGRGWVPADASRGSGAVRRFDNFRNFWGRVPAGLLQTWRGEGGNGCLIGWQYVAEARARERVRALPVAVWIEEPPDRLEPAVEEVTRALEAGLDAEALRRLARDRLRREVLFLSARRVDPGLWVPFARALLEARHPAALWYAAMASRAATPGGAAGAADADGRGGAELPSELELESLSDLPLAQRLRTALADDRQGVAAFEDLWRKTRATIGYDEKKGKFVLASP